MRPERAVVKKALVDAGGNKSRAAALLGCTRQSLYTWIYQYGLDRLAGIRMDRRAELDARERQYTGPTKQKKPTVYSGHADDPSLRLVGTQIQTSDLPVQATFKVRESVWKQMKIEAIRRGCTVAALAEEAFEVILRDELDGRPKRRRRNGSAGNAEEPGE